jgi:Zn-dependent protease with chaperone function
VIGSAVVGMIAGVGINFALGAFYLRRMLPAREITDASFKERLQKCFTSAGLPSPSLWIIETGRSREATAMMAGFPWGRGFFRPGLFLSRALVDALTPEELRAVVLHEVSHLKLQHLRKRLTYSISLVVGTTTAATFCVFLAGVFLPGSDLRDFIGFAAAAGAFVLTFRLLGKQSRGHEHEADFYSVGALKAGVEDLVNALRKLDIINGRTGSANKNPIATAGIQGHPATELRVVALRERFASTESAATAAHEESDRAA